MEGDDWVGNLEIDLVPRVPEDSLETVVFLYPNHNAAVKGLKSGSTGFMVAQPFQHGFGWHGYVVTNRHCVENQNVTVRAMAQTEDGPDVVFADTKAADWILHDEYDVAIYPWKKGAEEVPAHTNASLLDCTHAEYLKLGPGEDVFTVSRFIHQDGGEQNHPIVHSGMLAKLPLDPIKNPHTKKFEYDFLVEMHSRGGYSGSPVTLYIMPGQVKLSKERNVGPQLLIMGVLWGHVLTQHEVMDPRKDGPKKGTGDFVQLETMIAGVVPAWEIVALLNGDEAVKQRMEYEEQVTKEKHAASEKMDPWVTDSAESEEGFTAEDFGDALHRVTRIKPDESAPEG
jgi:hypothetical protein